jgi:hypothetical protein
MELLCGLYWGGTIGSNVTIDGVVSDLAALLVVVALVSTGFPVLGGDAKAEYICCGVGRYEMELGMIDSQTEIPDGGGGADSRILLELGGMTSSIGLF